MKATGSAAISELDSWSDAALADRLKQGNVDAVAFLYRRHAGPLLQLASRLSGSAADGEDVVQDVFVGLQSALLRYQEQGAFAAWLRRTTARAALMRLRRVGARREVPIELAVESVSDHADRIADRIRLEEAIQSLPETLRGVFVLRQMEAWSYAEIAAQLGIRRGTAEVRFHRAIHFLRGRLERR
jgi:RNA polymerase sigma-70 factor (ECF subfamily)